MPVHANSKYEMPIRANRTFCMLIVSVFLASILAGCVPPSPSPEDRAAQFVSEQTEGSVDVLAVRQEKKQPVAQLPVRYQSPSYALTIGGDKGSDSAGINNVSVPFGYKYNPDGPKPLSTVMQLLADKKKMNISWASDVDKNALVHVTIMPEEDFFEAIDNILRQVDYFHELQGNTIVVRHKETKKFHIAMPFLSRSFSSSVGGDVLGSTQGSNMSGTLNIESNDNKFDVWGNIEDNLDKILEIWSAATPTTALPADSSTTGTTATSSKASTPAPVIRPPAGKGYYTIDRPIGLVTVTAPRSLIEKIDHYLTNLKTELYRQISIEAKIVEVTLTGDDTTGLDWNGLLNDTDGFGLNLDFQHLSSTTASTFGKYVTFNNKSFSVLIDAIKKQGNVEVLSNPKISVMNGQPAMISVGENVTYVDSVASTTTDGVTTFTINTASVMSGLGLGIVANIGENDEIVISMTPVTSELTQPIEYRTFGSNQVGLPKVNLREMTTIIRANSGEMVVVGGLIDNLSTYSKEGVAGLGDIPVAGKLFGKDGTVTHKKELIILLRPVISSF